MPFGNPKTMQVSFLHVLLSYSGYLANGAIYPGKCFRLPYRAWRQSLCQDGAQIERIRLALQISCPRLRPGFPGALVAEKVESGLTPAGWRREDVLQIRPPPGTSLRNRKNGRKWASRARHS
jgi:hypothetical protein